MCWLVYLCSPWKLVVVGWPICSGACEQDLSPFYLIWQSALCAFHVLVGHMFHHWPPGWQWGHHTWLYCAAWCLLKVNYVNVIFYSSLFILAGSICNCILPEALKISAVRHDPNYQEYDSEKRRLRSAFNCLSSISMRQRQLSTSSMFLHSPLKGCLPPWELRRSTNRSLKDR